MTDDGSHDDGRAANVWESKPIAWQPGDNDVSRWQRHMADIAQRLHDRSHDLNASYGRLQGGPASPERRSYIEACHSLCAAAAYFFNCTSSFTAELQDYDRPNLSRYLETAARHVRESVEDGHA